MKDTRARLFCAIVLLALFFAGCVGGVPFLAGSAAGGTADVTAGAASPGMDLDAAIRAAAVQMERNLPGGTKIALVSVASSSANFSEYVISRLEAVLVNGRKLVVVDRANLDQIRAEQGFQLSGEVDDASAKSIGKLLGAGAIVTGAFIHLGDMYGLTLKAINIETATVAVSYPADIAKSTRIETLLASGGGAGAPAGGQAAATAAGPADGTYTFWPRVQAFQGARAVSVYLGKIVVLRGYMTIYIYATPEGDGGYTEILRGSWNAASLKDMESGRSARLVQTVNKAGVVYGSVTMCDLTFQNVTGTRLVLASTDSPAIEFYDIVLEEPDK